MYQDHSTPTISVFISIFSAIIAFIGMAQVQTLVSLVAGITAIASGIFAVRHFYYSTKASQLEIKKMEDEKANR